MDFEWDSSKEQANRRKYGVDFETAAKVFLDPHVIEYDDWGAHDEMRFNAIGSVDGRMLFVTYTIREDVIYNPRRCNSHYFRKRCRTA